MKVIATEKAPGAIGPYSQGFVTNGFVYTSGQIPVNPADGTIPAGIAAQAQQSCKNAGADPRGGRQQLRQRWSRPPASSPTSRILRPSTRSTPSSSPPSPPAAAWPSRTCPRASCARSRPSPRRKRPADFPLYCRKKDQNRPAAPAGGSGLCFLFGNRTRCPDVARGGYFRNLCTARATMPPRMPETRNSATPCTPTSRTTNMRGLAAPLTDTRF